MSVFSGDFLGFQLGNIHSSQLNITRVSNSGWYSEGLTPNFSDSTAVAPGRDGTYYWQTNYSQKPITIDFAFDNLSVNELQKLRQVLGFKGVQELVFDESLYKKYIVKCSSPPTLKYVAFADNNVIIYKGEGTVNLVAFYPYAISTTKNILGNCLDSSGNASSTLISNIGDIEMPIKMIFRTNKNPIITLQDNNDNIIKQLNIENLVPQTGDTYYCIDMRTHLIEGLDTSIKKTGHLYNQFITTGDFFNIPTGTYRLNSSQWWSRVTYNYLYY